MNSLWDFEAEAAGSVREEVEAQIQSPIMAKGVFRSLTITKICFMISALRETRFTRRVAHSALLSRYSLAMFTNTLGLGL